uniref:Uncharacterized protein n=1 Tax=Oryza brachyantha TaxID=4533 RepID=J3LH48_ORYBR
MDGNSKVIEPASVEASSVDGSLQIMVSEKDDDRSSDVLMVPNSCSEDEDLCLCKRCGEVHGVQDIEACRRIRREQSRCSRCRLVHNDYDLSAWIVHGFEKFECELYIPNIDEMQMDGETIILPEHVQKRVDELCPSLQKIKEQEANKKTDA